MPVQLRNQYLLMRHGHSEANACGRIVSDPAIGTQSYGLSDKGIRQVRSSLTQWRSATPVRVYCSDFKRTRETAELVAEHFAVPVTQTTELRERNFGDLDGADDQQYAQVWQRDPDDSTHNYRRCESPDSVRDRAWSLIKRLEQQHQNETILLVSHGDTLQILQTLPAGIAAGEHRSLAHMDTAEVRPLVAQVCNT